MSSDVVFRAFAVGDVPGQEPVRLDPAEERRAVAMAPAVARRFRAGRMALRGFAGALLDVPPSELTADYCCPQCGLDADLAHGRPGYSLHGRPLPLLLSLARAGDWILLAGMRVPAAGLRLGVDIEDPADVGFPGFDRTALTAAEAATVGRTRERLRNAARARLWARKEAWLKMEGGGLRTAPVAVDVLSLPGLRDLVPEETGLPPHLASAMALG
ncbi:4'-phosphopantetheinyl transferase superfamily protein [Pseudarthrobacter sp. J75]|uniref:4'-phosphopantetheinyl transferase family protein n=1 Tax=unclassified Pseudarthrobacter TaxID=2647000 RepID=UPI002E81985F|nr:MULTISPECIES: 4'-phosphopantetheinyl transferase superfamily protein [unclassified Pseudarthrobacter]MEE2521865.1 4'-phosphopantetheinyl transferase superfamily protein [Pseudarthrobacter sp. J47]MEE2527942.1 4'-phosphopantetheinyl transferase superfamily protein [Pseudarthrobacter sp. J75]